jgi:hypothetical protein
MKREILLCTISTLAMSLWAADPGPGTEVAGAAKKLEQAANYSWKTVVEFGNFTGTTEGKAAKDGGVWLSMSFGDNTTEALRQGDKWAVKRSDHEWQSLKELESESQGPERFLVRRLQNFKTPTAEAGEIIEKLKEVKKDGETYSGELTEEGAKDLLSFGPRRANAPDPKDAKGSAKIWTKDGAMVKYELKLQGKITFNGEERDVDRTTTVEFKDVGSTKIEAPEAAKKKLS